MIIHPNIPSDYHAKLLATAKRVGLDSIQNWSARYRITKVAGKTDNTSHQYSGRIYIIGSEDIGLYLWSRDEWFRTSNIVLCVRVNDHYVIETRNSYYELRMI
jgi:hypothetical protein